MLRCEYKTRGQSLPQDKPRVYFCCHHDDFEEYFDEVSDSILKISDCAIYYRDGAERRSPPSLEDMSEFFSLIKLVVIPVTRNFLFEPNSAREIEFKFAIDNHIPVLPLLQEVGIEYEFNKQCGDLHLINANAYQDMFSTYDQQLQKFVESVLLDDKLSQRIRAAFDAYIFLSYRKKDRKAAHQLMRLIHKNDFCRDVAIWYDEFLVPGENFNDGIRDALIKSRLFALVVTPNLLEENNYVMNTEFPMAKQAKKPIFAVKLEQTDGEQLAKYYDGLDYLIDATETQMISNALTKVLLCEAQSPSALMRSDDAEHLFLIGLAYLCGIDVEKDAERALSLIERASLAGLDEATQKLADMYLLGDEVERDAKRAYEYQKKLLSSKAKAYNDDPCQSNALDYADAIIEAKKFAQISKVLNGYGIKNMLTKHLGELEYITNDVGEWTDDLKFKVAMIYGMLSEASELYDIDEAIDHAWSAHNYLLDLAESSNDPEHISALFIISACLGKFSIKKGNEEEGFEWFSLCEDCLCVQLQKFPDNNALEWAYIQTLGAICGHYYSKRDFKSAKEIYHKALDFARKLYEKDYSERVRDVIILILCALSSIELGFDDIQSATSCAMEALELQKKQKRFADPLKLCDCYHILAYCYSADGQKDKTRENLELAMECLTSHNTKLLTQEEFAMTNRLINIYLELSDVCEALGDDTCAYRYYQRYDQLKKAHDELLDYFSDDSQE